MVCLHYRGFVGWLKYSFPFLPKWLKYSLPFTEGYALAALPNLSDSPYQEASRSTMSNVKKRILSKADNFLTEMATCLRI